MQASRCPLCGGPGRQTNAFDQTAEPFACNRCALHYGRPSAETRPSVNSYIVVTVDNVVQGGGDLEFSRDLAAKQAPEMHAELYVRLNDRTNQTSEGGNG